MPDFRQEQDDKPGSVVNNHLSSTVVASRVKRPTWKQAGQACRLRFGLASDGVYMAPPVTGRTVVSYTAFPPLPNRIAHAITAYETRPEEPATPFLPPN